LLNIQWMDDDEDDEALLADGYRPGEVWGENWPALILFTALITQWRMGPSGPIGLDYAVVPQVAREVCGLRRRALREVWWPLQVMEGESLQWFAEQRPDDDR
jgi:Phage related hypothetical protein (DUF1799)